MSESELPRISRRETLKVAIGTAVGWAALGLVGCRPAATSTTAPLTTNGPTPTPVKVKIGIILANAENMFLHLGEDAGVYRAHGIIPEFVELPDAGTIIKALVAHEVEIGEIGAGPTLAATSKGAGLIMVGTT